MPSIAQMATSGSIGSSPIAKKRKRQQVHADAESHVKSNSPQNSLHFADSRSFYNIELADHSSGLVEPQQQRLFIIPRSMKLSRPHDTKRQRIFLTGFESRHNDPRQRNSYDEDHSSISDARSNGSSSGTFMSAASTNYAKPDLSSCHICHQKPKVRSDLDSYADCEGCGMRTCYICMRECLGPSLLSDGAEFETNQLGIRSVRDEMSFATETLTDDVNAVGQRKGGTIHGWNTGDSQAAFSPQYPNSGGTRRDHKGMICSRCCMERGVDGEVRCLGCLRTEQSG